MTKTSPVVKKDRRARRSWYFYDFGNSAYAAVVLLAVFSAYFKGVVVGGAEGTRLWGIAVGSAAILVAIISRQSSAPSLIFREPRRNYS